MNVPLVWNAYSGGFLASYVGALSAIDKTIFELSEQSINYATVKALSVEISNTVNPNPITINISGRQLVIPPYGYAVLRIPYNANFVWFLGYAANASINFYSFDQSETLLNFARANQQIDTVDYLEQTIAFTKPVAGAGALINYAATMSGLFTPGQAINIPIKVANIDANRLRTIFGNTFNDAQFGIYGYYGFSSGGCIIPFNGGIFLLNNPMTTAEFWIKFDYSLNTATASTWNHGTLLKEFYGHS